MNTASKDSRRPHTPPTHPGLRSVLRARPPGAPRLRGRGRGPESSYRRPLSDDDSCGRFGSRRGAGSPRTFVRVPRPTPRRRPSGPAVRAPRPPPAPLPPPPVRPRSAPGPADRAPAPGPSLTPAPFAFLFRTPRPPGGRASPPGTCSLSAFVVSAQPCRLLCSLSSASNYNYRRSSRELPLSRWVPAQGSREAVGGARGAT